jgi:methionine biosynthesis protein MetW
MSSQSQKHDRYWQQRALDDFESYERNWLVSEFFHQGERVLDVAGGDGSVSRYLKNSLGCQVSLIDNSRSAVKKAKARGISDAAVVDLESEKIPYPSQVFDAIFWGDNIEHLYHPGRVAKEIYRVLKRNGRLIISTPNMGYWRYRLHYFVRGNLPRTEWSEAHLWESQHIRFFNAALLEKFLELHRFRLTRLAGVNRRKVDKYLSRIYPKLFSMILVAEAKKR